MPFQTSSLRPWIILLVAVLFNSAPAVGQTSKEVLALVNDFPITRDDVVKEAAIIEADIQLRNLSWSRDQIGQLSAELVETLIERELLYQRAKLRNIEIRTQWIERAFMDLKDKVGNPAAFDSYLKSIELTQEQLKDRIRKGLIVRRLLHREVIQSIKVSEAEMQAFYGKHPDFFMGRHQARVRQIFIAADKQDDAALRGKALQRIQSIQTQLREGADFSALALEYSEDPSKARGGDLGYLERNQLIPSFADAAFILQPGEISDIVETRLGYHLIQMVDNIPTSQMAYRNARIKIERTLRRNKERAATMNYLANLKKQANIKR